ncbi:imelysin family protein [Mesoflavibacter profundi]|uniref:imelysin family protein n=1 Tax=Mesoflavibacter profundi TaxID=2708110 RepID=UPI0035153FF6
MKKIALSLFILITIVACTSSEESSSSVRNDGFDRGAMLSNWANNSIIPALQDLDQKLETLQEDKNTFISTVNQTNLEQLRTSWLEAYKVWQHVEMFNIGKAEEISYVFQMNVYPTNTQDIESNIASQNYDLSAVGNNDAVGFPALDYMLFGLDTDDNAILSKYNDANYVNYLNDLVDRMVDLNAIVLTDWQANYINSFTASTDNTSTSAVNKLTNDFIFYYEKGFRANKFGIPAGVFSGSTPLSEKVEGYYSKVYSKTLALEAIDAVQNFFNGVSYDQLETGSSFSSYLNYLNRQDLVTTITTKLNNGRDKINTLQDNFYSQVNTDNTQMTETFDVLQLAVVSFKVDMLQAFNINVDYVDADGD